MPLSLSAPITTERLLLRLIEEGDLPGLMAVNGDDAATRFLPYATWNSLDDARAWYLRIQGICATGKALQLVMVDRRSAEPIGTCLLFNHDEGSARADIGYVLGRRHWRNGYMREALQALIGCAFGTMGLRRLEAEVDVRNDPSNKLILRMGFTKEGTLRQRYLTKGELKDINLYGLLRHEWPPG